MLIYGIDPGKNGAWAAINHNGEYHSCGDMIHNGIHIDVEKMWLQICESRAGEDCIVALELVHSMPRDGVKSAFSFGVSFGGAIAIAQRMHCPCTMVSPREWKKDMKLTSDKKDSLRMARQLWPEAPLKLEKHDGRAEALLLSEWLRRQMG